MASFYRRFVRDYARYRDEIQCAGAELVAAIRARARARRPDDADGTYYALHVRRGDFQFREARFPAQPEGRLSSV